MEAVTKAKFTKLVFCLLKSEHGIDEDSFRELKKVNEDLKSRSVELMLKNADATDGMFYLTEGYRLTDFIGKNRLNLPKL